MDGQGSHKPPLISSNLIIATRYYAQLTQRLECNLYTVEVRGSNPLLRTRWAVSIMVEHWSYKPKTRVRFPHCLPTMKRLTIYNSLNVIAIIVKTDKEVLIEYVKPRVAEDIGRWIKHGFSGYDMTTFRHYSVEPTDENFLEEVAKRAACYNFKTLIEEVEHGQLRIV